jgi:ubiquinol-cytochrome c reductase cytochrome c subunit
MSRLVTRWLTRRSRIPRALRLAAALVLGAMAIVGLAAPPSSGQGGTPSSASAPATAGSTSPSKLPAPPGPGDPTKSFPSSPELIAEGRGLYESTCASCHGVTLGGTAGVAPSLRGVGPGPVDFYLSTGRMPLEQPHEEPIRNEPLFKRGQIDAIIAFVSSFGGPPAPAAVPGDGNLSVGFHQFTLNCAGCHQVVARGGITAGAVAPDLLQATPEQIAEAVRMGPYLMPHFDSKQIDQYQLNSIARYILWTRHPDDAGGWGLYNIGPIPEGIVAWFIGLVALVIIARLIGERNDEGEQAMPEGG